MENIKETGKLIIELMYVFIGKKIDKFLNFYIIIITI